MTTPTPNPYENHNQPPAYTTPGFTPAPGYAPEGWQPPVPEPPKKKRKGWWIAGGVLAVLLVIGALTDSDETPEASADDTPAQEEVTEEATQEPAEEPEEEPATEESSEEPEDAPQPVEEPVEDVAAEPEPTREPFTGDLDYEESMIVLELAFASSDSQTTADACMAYDLFGSDTAYEEFSAGYGDGSVDRQAFNDFFAENC